MHAPDESTRIEILDGNLRTVALDHNLGDVSLELPAGVYAVRFYQGRQFVEKLAALTPASPDVQVRLEPQEEPEFVTAAPVPGTSSTREWQRDPARDLSLSAPITPPGCLEGGSRLLLFLRNPFEAHADALSIGVTLCDLHDHEVFNLGQDGHANPHQQWVGAHLNLDPGAYKLRRSLTDGSVVEQMVFTRPDWQTQLFLLASRRSEQRAEILRTSILMARTNVGFDFGRPDFRWTESALRALESRGNIPGAARNEMLWAKFENPMLGIYAALLHLRRERIESAQMREVFFNLCGLVGPLPDVLAIGWGLALRDTAFQSDQAFTAKLHEVTTYDTPPMLRESWRHLLRATASHPELVSQGSLVDQVGGRLTAGGPWVGWISGPPAKASAATDVSLPDPQELSAARSGQSLFDRVRGVWDQFRKWAQDTALQSALGMLARGLKGDPEARHWLQTRRFTDLERAVVYWIRPQLNPQLTGVLEIAPELEKTLESTDRVRATDVVTLLTELNLISTTALRTAWSAYTKLYLRPVFPNDARLQQFIKEEGRDQALLVRTLTRLRTRTSGFHCPPIGRRLNLLEFAFLYYRGSPADARSERHSIELLAERLEEAKVVFGDEERQTTADVISLEHETLQQEVIGTLQRSRQKHQLPPGWQTQIFPEVQHYVRGALFPRLKKELASDTKPPDPAPSGPVPA